MSQSCEIGNVIAIKISYTSHENAACYIEKVIVEKDGDTFKFPCYQWIQGETTIKTGRGMTQIYSIIVVFMVIFIS